MKDYKKAIIIDKLRMILIAIFIFAILVVYEIILDHFDTGRETSLFIGSCIIYIVTYVVGTYCLTNIKKVNKLNISYILVVYSFLIIFMAIPILLFLLLLKYKLIELPNNLPPYAFGLCILLPLQFTLIEYCINAKFFRK
ncbi:MAG: hypothetical protein PHD01_07380 [Geobacteraceae bacterium]|nr:hypothetical protein [Geobacteraceae bacterium]